MWLRRIKLKKTVTSFKQPSEKILKRFDGNPPPHKVHELNISPPGAANLDKEITAIFQATLDATS